MHKAKIQAKHTMLHLAGSAYFANIMLMNVTCATGDFVMVVKMNWQYFRKVFAMSM